MNIRETTGFIAHALANKKIGPEQIAASIEGRIRTNEPFTVDLAVEAIVRISSKNALEILSSSFALLSLCSGFSGSQISEIEACERMIDRAIMDA